MKYCYLKLGSGRVNPENTNQFTHPICYRHLADRTPVVREFASPEPGGRTHQESTREKHHTPDKNHQRVGKRTDEDLVRKRQTK